MTIIFKVGVYLYLALFMSLTSYTVFLYYQTREFTYILPARLPMIDEHTYQGFIVLTTFQVVVLIVAYLGTTGSDFTSIMFLLNGIAVTEVFRNGCQRFNVMARDRNVSSAHTKYALRNLVIMQQYFRKYVENRNVLVSVNDVTRACCD